MAREGRDETGHRPLKVTTSAGVVQVKAPRVHDKRINEATGERKRFSSAILSPWARKSPKSSEVRQADRAVFMDRDLFATGYVQVWADGTEELIAMTDGYRESSDAWTGLPTCPG